MISFCWSVALVDFFRRPVIKRLVRSFFVVEGKVEIQPFPNIVDGGVRFDVDVFIFDGGSQIIGVRSG